MKTIPVALILLCWSLSACAPREDPLPPGDRTPTRPVTGAPPASDTETLTALRDTIQTIVGDATASDPASCRTIPLGAKPCGGPWTYLVFSSEMTDSVRLFASVDRYNETEARLNAVDGRVSDCSYVARPQVEIRGGRCVTIEGPVGGR